MIFYNCRNCGYLSTLPYIFDNGCPICKVAGEIQQIQVNATIIEGGAFFDYPLEVKLNPAIFS